MKTLMKYSAKAVIVTALAWASCSEIKKEETDSAESLAQNNKALTASNDSLQLAFAQTLNEIDHNLDLIREKEGTLVLGPESNAEPGITKSEHIQRNISIINSLMEQNKEKLSKLNAQLKKSKANNAMLTKLAEGTKLKIEKQEEEIAQLKTQLTDKSFEVEKLNIKMNDLQLANAMLEDKSNKLDKNVNSAYYAVGSYEELEKEHLMEKQSGVLGMMKKKTLKDDFKKEYFTEVDKRNTDSIPLFAKKAKLLTFHPKNSFALEKDKDKITWLKIKDPDEFWKTSKYLVVEVQKIPS